MHRSRRPAAVNLARFPSGLLLGFFVVFATACAHAPPGAMTLSGPPEAPVATKVPEQAYQPEVSDFATDHPDLPGMPISFNTLTVVFTLDTTVATASEILNNVQASIVGGQPGVEGQIPGVLRIRLPTENHQQMETVLTGLEQNPAVQYVLPDTLLGDDLMPHSNNGNPEGWGKWSIPALGGNWGLEILRAPQMWNLNAALEKQDTTCSLGIVDSGFESHTDLAYHTNLTPYIQGTHGVKVAGIASATFSNGIGIDGINPLSDLVVYATPFPPFPIDLYEQLPDIKVVNMSQGYQWEDYGLNGINPSGNPAAQTWMTTAGAIFATAWSAAAAYHEMPLLVVSAGNNSNQFPQGADCHDPVDAVWNSPHANAALQHGIQSIVVVEALRLPGTGGPFREEYSNINGHFSAPGRMLTTDANNGYVFTQGTSYAAPFIAGVAGYLYCVDAELSHGEVRSLLSANARPAAPNLTCGGPAPGELVDAWASVMDIDRIRGNDRVLRMMLDIDDGTPDGNLRANPQTGAAFTDEDADGDGGIGDGDIDMSDFRRWRDWFLQVSAGSGLQLDGSASHLKKDVNGNGTVEQPDKEDIYPRGDFNGDGRLSLADPAYVPGAIDDTVTDLAVLQTRFADPHYATDDLDDLVASGDLTLDAETCLNTPDVTKIEVSIRATDTSAQVEARELTDENPVEVFTVPIYAAGYTVRVDANDHEGTLNVVEKDLPFALGSDDFWSPDCTPPVDSPPSGYCYCYELMPCSECPI